MISKLLCLMGLHNFVCTRRLRVKGEYWGLFVCTECGKEARKEIGVK